MHIGAENLPVGGNGTVDAAVIEHERGAVESRAGASAHVDLVTAHLRPIEHEASAHVVQVLSRLELGAKLQPPEAGALARPTPGPKGVGDRLAEHLKTAADADHFATVTQVPLEHPRPALLA